VTCAACRRTLGKHKQRKSQQKSFQHIREYGYELVHEMAKARDHICAGPPLPTFQFVFLGFQLRFMDANKRPNVIRHVQQLEPLFFDGVGVRRIMYCLMPSIHVSFIPLPEPDVPLSKHPALQLSGFHPHVVDFWVNPHAVSVAAPCPTVCL